MVSSISILPVKEVFAYDQYQLPITFKVINDSSYDAQFDFSKVTTSTTNPAVTTTIVNQSPSSVIQGSDKYVQIYSYIDGNTQDWDLYTDPQFSYYVMQIKVYRYDKNGVQEGCSYSYSCYNSNYVNTNLYNCRALEITTDNPRFGSFNDGWNPNCTANYVAGPNTGTITIEDMSSSSSPNSKKGS